MTPQAFPREPASIPTADGGAHVIVTIESIYTLLLEVRDDVRGSSSAIDKLANDSDDHEIRIRSLERKVWIASGLAAATGTALGKLLSMNLS